MIRPESSLAPDAWLHDVLSSRAVAQGNVIRRKRRDIERFVGMKRFLEELRMRGFQALENREDIIVICNQAPVRRLL